VKVGAIAKVLLMGQGSVGSGRVAGVGSGQEPRCRDGHVCNGGMVAMGRSPVGGQSSMHKWVC
jgi:hypothetical protein